MLRSKSLMKLSSTEPAGYLRRSESAATIDNEKNDFILGPNDKEHEKEGNLKRARFVSFESDRFRARYFEITESGFLYRTLPTPDCHVQVMNMIFECNQEVLSRYLDMERFPVNNKIPININSDRLLLPESFWWVYCWMNTDVQREDYVNIHWALPLYFAGLHLGIDELWVKCYEFLMDKESVNEEVAFLMLKRCQRYNRADLQDYFANCIKHSFLALASSEDFYNLFWDEVLLILQSDNIVVSGELEVLYAAMFWLEDSDERKKTYMSKLISAVRLSLMDPSQLMSVIAEFPDLLSESRVFEQFHEAIKVSVFREEYAEEFFYMNQANFRTPRKMPYKPLNEQPHSYEEFLSEGQRIRLTNPLFQNNRVNLPANKLVTEMRRCWEMEKARIKYLNSVNYRRSCNYTF